MTATGGQDRVIPGWAPETDFANILYNAGFLYDPAADILYSRKNASQFGLLGEDVDPDAPMTRVQTAELLYAALELLGMKPSMTLEKAREAVKDFSDLGGLTDEQTIAMGVLIELGIFKGNGDGTMGAEDSILRCQMAALAVRFQDMILGLEN